MGDVTSTIKLNGVNLTRLKQAQITALEKTAEAIHKRIQQSQIVPFDTGNLQNEAFTIDNSQSSKGKITISHSTPYARRLYFHPEYNFSTDENIAAQGRWFEPWLPGGTEEDYALRRYKAFLKKESGI